MLLAILAGLTVFFGYHARDVEMSYEYASLIPQKDSAYIDYQRFVEIFGEEGNLILVGISDSEFFRIDRFRKWSELCDELTAVEGVENLLSVSNTYDLVKNSEEHIFEIKPVFQNNFSDQIELDSLKQRFYQLPFYKKMVYNPATNAYLLAITVNKDKMKSRERERLIITIKQICQNFEDVNQVKLHYSGLPYIRVINSIRIKKEIYMFSFLALLICIVVLFLFFRSVKAVVFPVLIVMTGVVWSMGLVALFGFKITILSGMVPALIIVIGIPNSIYMMNKFHHEFVSHGNKVKALQRVIIKIGNATFLTNLTTAAGFGTFILVKSNILKEFGIIASLSVMALFILSVLLIPIIFSFVRPPSSESVRHLEYRFMVRIIDRLILIARKHHKTVYSVTIVVLVLGVIGIFYIKESGYMVDDIPENDPIYKDLKFFEQNFDGLMPLEIMVDTKKPNGVTQLSTFYKIEKLEQKLGNYPELSTSLSLLNLLKFSKQAYYNGKEYYYSLPNNMEKNFILQYASKGEANAPLLHSFLDSTRQVTRISIRMKDVGTKQMGKLYGQFKTDIDSIFNKKDFNVTVTGSSVTFFKGTEYLLRNLIQSLIFAFILISAIMASMFSSWRMVIVSLLPNVIPLVLTAAIMGYAGIPIKSSTILVFSIAFGISVDNTIHFLTKYRQELKATGWKINRSVILALHETGVSMIYTAVVLFFGFGIFSISSFGGIIAMGILVSITLLMAVTSNLILLPALLTSLDRLTTSQSFKEPLVYVYDEEEEIDIDNLELEQPDNSEP